MNGHDSSTSVPELSIIIVNWNSKDLLRQCLTSLYRHCQKTVFEVIVVDGASFDGCDEMQAREFPAVRFVQSPENIGFGRCNNLGVQHAQGQYFLFLNPDTVLLEDSIAILMERARSLPEAGAVGCRLLNADRSLQTSCVQPFPTVLNQVIDSHFLRTWFPKWSVWGMQALYKDNDDPAEVEVISGACMLIPKQVFIGVGGFSAQYFMYGEDLDLCFKICETGKKIYSVLETSIVHHGGCSTQKYSGNFSSVAMRDSVHKFLREHRGAATAGVYRLAMAGNALVRLVFIVPCLMFTRNGPVRHGLGSLKKWTSILGWGFGKDPIYASAAVPAGASGGRAHDLP